jgi:hypothetical protein
MVQIQLSTSRTRLEQCPEPSRDIGDQFGTAWALINPASTLVCQAEFGEAHVRAMDHLLEEAGAIWTELGERRHLAVTFGMKLPRSV